jgi:hypothetical protein
VIHVKKCQASATVFRKQNFGGTQVEAKVNYLQFFGGICFWNFLGNAWYTDGATACVMGWGRTIEGYPQPETLEIISLCRPITCPVLCPLPNFGRSVRLMFGTQFLAWKRARVDIHVDIGVTSGFAWFIPYRKYWSALAFDFRTLLLAEGREPPPDISRKQGPIPFAEL